MYKRSTGLVCDQFLEPGDAVTSFPGPEVIQLPSYQSEEALLNTQDSFPSCLFPHGVLDVDPRFWFSISADDKVNDEGRP